MAGRVEQVWTEVLDRASEQIDVSSLRVWFEGIRPVDLHEDRLEISVPNTFAKEYIESRFRPLLEEVLNSVTGEETSLVVSVAGPGAHATNGAAAGGAESALNERGVRALSTDSAPSAAAPLPAPGPATLTTREVSSPTTEFKTSSRSGLKRLSMYSFAKVLGTEISSRSS